METFYLDNNRLDNNFHGIFCLGILIYVIYTWNVLEILCFIEWKTMDVSHQVYDQISFM